MDQYETAHIFFPFEIQNREGYLIGYNVKGLICTIINVDSSN